MELVGKNKWQPLPDGKFTVTPEGVADTQPTSKLLPKSLFSGTNVPAQIELDYQHLSHFLDAGSGCHFMLLLCLDRLLRRQFLPQTLQDRGEGVEVGPCVLPFGRILALVDVAHPIEAASE